jgi:hypothetical protein
MSGGRENLQVRKKTFKTAANSAEMDYDSIMRFPAETEHEYIKRTPKKSKSVKSALTAHDSDSDEDFYRGRYMGKDRMKNSHVKRSTGLFVPELNKEPMMGFNSSTDTGPISFIERQRKKEREEVAKKACSMVEADKTAAGDTANNVEGAATGCKRKRATCAGPERVKRSYVWKDGGKRAGEAGVQKKIKMYKAKPKNADKKNKDIEDSNGYDDAGAGGEGGDAISA